jgi:hypothetical protein
MAENTATMTKVCIVDHKKHVKEKGKIPLLLSYFSNVYPFHALIDLFVFSTKMVFFSLKKVIYLFILFVWKRDFKSRLRYLEMEELLFSL